MAISDLSFSASLPPFNYTSGFANNFSNTNLAVSGNLSVATGSESANGANNPTVLSSITENGVNFAANNATFNGNKLTVDYSSSNISGGGAGNQGSIASPLTVNINGNGLGFTPQKSDTAGSTVTTTYATTPNTSYNNAVPNAAISFGSSSDNENYTLTSLAFVGNSIVATYQITNPPSNQDTASAAAPPVSATVTASSPSSVNTPSATFTNSGNISIGSLLANSNGLTLNGTITGALQQPPSIGSVTGYPDANSILAAALDPSVNLSPSSQIQVTDFINTSLNAYPTSAPPNPTPENSSNDNNNTPSANAPANNSFDSGNDNSPPATQGADFIQNSNNSFGSSVTPAYDNSYSSNASASTGIYSAISNANASTIRGTGVDTVA